MKITSAQVVKVLNSEGDWTLQATLTYNSHTAISSVPRGRSAGKYEAHNLNEEDAITIFTTTVKDLILKEDFKSSEEFDKFLLELDGTTNKTKLGSNLILSLSIAFCKLISKKIEVEPFEYISDSYELKPNIPSFSLLIFEGGKHGSKYLTAQEYMLVESNIEEARSIIRSYKRYLDDNGLFVGYGLEGAFTSAKLNDSDVLKLLSTLTPHKKIAIDVAESSRQGDSLDYESIIDSYNIYSIEDPKHETDYKGWKDFYKKYNKRIVVVGDDLTTTNKTLMKNAKDEELANGIIIKPNQIGSVYETVIAVKLAKGYNWKTIVSHRGSDTNDNFIADLAVGSGADLVKFGGLQRGERIAKYNRVLEINNLLQNRAS